MHTLSAVLLLCLLVAGSSFRPAGRASIPSRRNAAKPLHAETKGGLNVGAEDKLVWDPAQGRFFERNLEEICEEEFCVLDESTGESILLTREEKERIFLDTVQQYYYGGNSSLSDEQFNRLKEDLSWEGSALVTMNRNETLFMNAIQAWNKGAPMMSDTEFDQLKSSLKESGSAIAVDKEPQCWVDTGVCKVTWSVDNLRLTSLYLPAAIISTLLFIGIADEIPGVASSVNILILLALGAVPISALTKSITENLIFDKPFVAGGPCPKCGVENRVFFGGILGVDGDAEESAVKCTSCKSGLTVKRSTLRVSTLTSPKGPPPKPAKA